MEILWRVFQLITISLFFSVTAFAQATNSEAQRFAKDGLLFEYPAGWKLTDKSNPQAQHLILTSENSTVLIMIIAYSDLIGLPEQLAAARREITEPFVNDTAQKLGGPTVKREQTQIKIRDIAVDGVRLRGVINKESATAEIYSFIEKLRFINLVYIRANKDGESGDSAWETIRRTLMLETPIISAKPEARGHQFSGLELSGKALRLPPPAYPSLARRSQMTGTAVIKVVIDEEGNVIEAKAVSGPDVFREPAVEAARGAKFTPTRLYGQPVKVTGVITYNFAP